GQTHADVLSGGTTVTVNMTPTDEVVVASPGDQSTSPGQTISLPIGASGSHCTPLTYSASNLPPGLHIDPTTGVISGTPASGAAGTYIVTITVSDGAHSTTTTVTVVVVDHAPVVTNPGPQTTPEGQPVALQLVAVDPDNDPRTCSASGLPPGLS